MTLNDAKEIIEEFKIIDDWSMIYLPRLHEALDTVIRIAEWYERQDLVRRRDVIKNLNEEFAKIPTAEPTTSSKMEQV